MRTLTERQRELIYGELLRHVAMAASVGVDAHRELREDHIEVAEALLAALYIAEEKEAEQNDYPTEQEDSDLR